MSFIDAIQGMSFFNGGTQKLNATDTSALSAMGGGTGSSTDMSSMLKGLSTTDVETDSQNKIAAMTSGVTDTGSTGATTGAATSSSSSGDSFASTLTGFIDSVDAKSKVAEQANQDLLTGKSDNIHQAMISMQEASISFDLLVQVRNKLVDAYKELSKMTV